jgi:dihydrodipicolinate synthase/N-acetylneuraminate lyase
MENTMAMTLLCRNATTFKPDKSLDEEALAAFLERFVSANLGVYVASGGSGEGHALTNDELRRVYEVSVAVCKGRVPVNGNPPERHSAAQTIEQCQIAAAAGVEVVNVYGPTNWHGFRPTPGELAAYFDEVLAEVRHPAAISTNSVVTTDLEPEFMADLCRRHPQVVELNLMNVSDAYYLRLKDALTREVRTYVPFYGSMPLLSFGASGLLGAEANIAPLLFRQYIDAWEAGDAKVFADIYAQVTKLRAFLRGWPGGSPRWIKMAMVVLGLPGAAGGLRSPYQLPPASEIDLFGEGLAALGIAELAAGLS